MDSIPMSREGYQKLKSELEELKRQLAETIAEIGRTRQFGDLSENAEYHAACEAKAQLEAKLRQKEDTLARAYIVDQSRLPKDQVVFGAKVRVLDLDLDEEEEFHFVGPGQEDYAQNKILITSPIGQGLLGKKVGEVAEIQVPQGLLRMKVIDISFE